MGRVLNRSRNKGNERNLVQGETPPPSENLWWSDWSTNIGNVSNALLDNGKWTNHHGGGDQLYVVTTTSTGLTWPTGLSNVLRIEWQNNSFNTQISTGIISAAPAVGEYSYHRQYLAVVGSGTQDLGFCHPYHGGDSFNNPLIYHWHTHPIDNGHFGLVIAFESPPDYPNNEFWYGDISTALGPLTSHVYMLQWSWLRVSSIAASLRIKVSDVDGVTGLVTETGFKQEGHTLAAYSGTFVVSDTAFTSVGVGNNDPTGTGVGFTYFGAMAYKVSNSSNDWIGAYDPVNG